MDRRLRAYFDRELTYLRGAAALFAGESPKIAGRLGIDRFGCSDPYVERLFQGAAFYSAASRLEIDGRFAMVLDRAAREGLPAATSSTPSMGVLRFTPDPSDDALAEGPVVPRGSVCQARVRGGQAIPYRTAHSVRLWPLEVSAAQYDVRNRDRHGRLPVGRTPAAVARVLLRTGLESIRGLGLDALSIYCGGESLGPGSLFRALAFGSIGAWAREPGTEAFFPLEVSVSCDQPGRAALPGGSGAGNAIRYALEWAACPDRCRFIEVRGFSPAVRACVGQELELLFALRESDLRLEERLVAEDLQLFATPAVNLFEDAGLRVRATDASSPISITDGGAIEPYHIKAVSVLVPGRSQTRALPAFGTARSANAPSYSVSRAPSSASGPFSGSEWAISVVSPDGSRVRADNIELSIHLLASSKKGMLELLDEPSPDIEAPGAAAGATVAFCARPSPPFADEYEPGSEWAWAGRLSGSVMLFQDTGGEATRELLKPVVARGVKESSDALASVAGVTSRRAVTRLPGEAGVSRGLEVEVAVGQSAGTADQAATMAPVLDSLFAGLVSPESYIRLSVVDQAGAVIAAFEPRRGSAMAV
ncbi:MAG: type VI secretion system baseplate subunit TssF [Planctomycetota bacterium]